LSGQIWRGGGTGRHAGLRLNPCLTLIPLSEILDGKHPYYQTNKLRLRLFSEGIKVKQCEVCGIEKWNGLELSFELDHIDGNRTNHILKNIRILCPNCHSQTLTYRGKNI
jgi:5-methylcytosine-specific restriction endonuclease McrA